MIKQSIITGGQASEFCVTRHGDDFLTIEFLWSSRPTDKKSCTRREAEQLRDALIQLYPLKEPASSEKVDYKVYPANDEWGSAWTVTAEFKNNNNNYSTGQALARFYDKQHAFDFVDLLKCKDLMKKTEKNFNDVFDDNQDELAKWNSNSYPEI